MIVIFDCKAKEYRIENENNPILTNIKHQRDYAILRNRKPQGRLINKIVRIIDVKEEERKYI